MTQASLSGTWVAARYGIDPVRVERLRRSGELFAVRSGEGTEWLYPAWQFDSNGRVRPAVQHFLAAARADRVPVTRLQQLLDLRIGLVGGKTVLELLLTGGEERALAEVRGPS